MNENERHAYFHGLVFGLVIGGLTASMLTLAICLTFGNAFPEEMWPSWTGILNR